MGEALISGLLRSGRWKASAITVSDPRLERLEKLRRTYHVHVVTDNRISIRHAEIIILAVKPQQINAVLEDIGSWVTRRQMVVSIAAGIRTGFIEHHLVPGVAVLRVMPNTPALIGMGASAVCRGGAARRRHETIARSIFETVGIVETLSENLMDAVTALSGSGPAYVFYLAEALTEAGSRLGLARTVAERLVRQTLRGAGVLLADSRDSASVLRQKVTSPGGTTEAALKVMESGRLKALVSKALARASERSKELSKEAGKR